MTGCYRTHVIKQLVLMMIDVVLVQTFSHVLTTSTTTVPTPTPTTFTCPGMPLSCVVQLTGCTCYCNTINCVDLGVLNTVPSVISDLHIANHSIILSISGHTKLLSIQARAFNGSNIQSIQLGRLGIKTIDPSAFTGLSNVVDIHLNGNGIRHIEPLTFRFDRSTSGPASLIDLSSNEIDLISGLSFFGNISAIDLSANRLRQLPDYVFSNVSSLTSLNLSSNRLSNLSSNVFFGLQSIVNLTISRNSINYIDQNAFFSLSSLQRLDLSENLITSFDRVQFSSTTLTYLNLIANRLAAVCLSTGHTFGVSPTIDLRLDQNVLKNWANMSVDLTNFALKSLSVTGNRIDRIPDYYFTEHTQLLTLDLSVNNITEISQSTFTSLQSLVSLNASSNNIDSLNNGTLADLEHLQYLNLADNYLSTLEPGIFDNCTALQTVDLSRNRIQFIMFGVFNKLVNLTYLDLSFNSVYYLTNESFAGLVNLQHLNLSNNVIDLLSSSPFYYLTHLTTLDLSANELPDSSLEELNLFSPFSLKSLNLNANRLTFSSCKFSLNYNAAVRLHDNLITNIDKFDVVFSDGGGSVDLSGNQITAIAPRSFSNGHSLSTLNLSSNNLTSINTTTFVGLTELHLLDLSDNRLTIIQAGTFSSVPQLRELRLARNMMTVISAATFDGLGGSLIALDISDNDLGNRFFGGTRLTGLTQLQFLVADGIGVSSIDGDTLPWTTLMSLSLRRNRITRIANVHNSTLKRIDLGYNLIGAEFLMFDLPSFELLETLILDHNIIDQVNGNRSFPRSLNVIDLSNNHLTSAALRNAFQSNFFLRTLTLDGNNVRNLNSIGLEASKRKLLALSVVNNQLGDDSWAVLSQLRSLQELRLDGNQLKKIPVSLFSTMFDMRTVSLSNNSLTRLDELTLDGLERSCTSLNLSYNAISFVNPSALARLSNLIDFDLSSNYISFLVFPPTLDNIRDLRLDNNQLLAFPDGPMQFRSIRTFAMSGNNLTTLPELEIYNSDGFVWLIDLSYNDLKDVDLVSLVGSFLTINFEGNALSKANVVSLIAMIDRVLHIEELNLDDNMLVDSFLSVTGLIDRLTTAVSVLHLDANSLTTLSSFQTLTTTTTSITRLSLAFNQISDIDDTFFPSISGSLVELDLRVNQLSSLDESTFSIDTNSGPLARLLLANNWWRCDCSLVWLRGGSTGLMIDDAICWTPQLYAGKPIVCYDIPAICGIDVNSLNISDQVTEWCDSFMTINDAAAPIVYDVWPLFGPVAGGTDVTITGLNMNFPSSIVALYPVDDLQYDVIQLSVPNNNSAPLYDSLMVAVTPDVSDTQAVDEQRKHLAVNVIFEGGPTVFTKKYFDFRPNANITGVSPTDHLITGGTLVTITGTDVDCTAVPKIRITVVVRRYHNSTDPGLTTPSSVTGPPFTDQISTSTEDCTMNITNTAVTCRMPPVPLEWLNNADSINGTNGTVPIAEAGSGVRPLVGPNSRDTASIYVGMIFDGFRGYDNFSSSLPNFRFHFFPLPTINNLDVIEFNPRQQTHIRILGENLQRGVQLADYLVTIGSEQCDLKDLTSNVLRCQPPVDEPPLVGSTNHLCTGMQLNAVMVGIGAEWQFCACIRYVNDPPNIGLIVGLTVGLGLPLIVIVIVVAVILCRRRKTKHDNNGRQRAPPDTENRQYYDTRLYGDLEESDSERQHYDTRLHGDLDESDSERSNRSIDTVRQIQGRRSSDMVFELKMMTPTVSDDEAPEVRESSPSITARNTSSVRHATRLRPHPHLPSLFPNRT